MHSAHAGCRQAEVFNRPSNLEDQVRSSLHRKYGVALSQSVSSLCNGSGDIPLKLSSSVAVIFRREWQ